MIVYRLWQSKTRRHNPETKEIEWVDLNPFHKNESEFFSNPYSVTKIPTIYFTLKDAERMKNLLGKGDYSTWKEPYEIIAYELIEVAANT